MILGWTVGGDRRQRHLLLGGGGGGALVAARAVLAAADLVGFGTHQRLHEPGDHLPEQVRTRLTQLLGQPAGQLNYSVVQSSCDASVSSSFAGMSEDHAVAVSRRHAQRRRSHTTCMDATMPSVSALAVPSAGTLVEVRPPGTSAAPGRSKVR